MPIDIDFLTPKDRAAIAATALEAAHGKKWEDVTPDIRAAWVDRVPDAVRAHQSPAIEPVGAEKFIVDAWLVYSQSPTPAAESVQPEPEPDAVEAEPAKTRRGKK